jgi:hypothetical protein
MLLRLCVPFTLKRLLILGHDVLRVVPSLGYSQASSIVREGGRGHCRPSFGKVLTKPKGRHAYDGCPALQLDRSY